MRKYIVNSGGWRAGKAIKPILIMEKGAITMTNYMENLTKNLDAMYAGKSEKLPLYMVIIHMTEKFRLKSLNFSP